MRTHLVFDVPGGVVATTLLNQHIVRTDVKTSTVVRVAVEISIGAVAGWLARPVVGWRNNSN